MSVSNASLTGWVAPAGAAFSRNTEGLSNPEEPANTEGPDGEVSTGRRPRFPGPARGLVNV